MENTKNSENNEIRNIKLALDCLCVYRNLLEDKVIKKLHALVDYLDAGAVEITDFMKFYNEFYFELEYSTNVSLKSYVIDRIIYDENPYSMRTQAIKFSDIDGELERAAANDLWGLQLISEVSSGVIKNYAVKYFEECKFSTDKIQSVPEWQDDKQYDSISFEHDYKNIKEMFFKSRSWSECIKELGEFHNRYGCGMYARYKAFIWERTGGFKCLRGIESPDTVRMSDLIGYDMERSKIVENTLQFIKGFPANNVLLYGDRGTGKSSTVKAILNEYYTEGLRIVEVPKLYLTDFPEIIRSLRNRPQKFIIFVDDLAFEDNEESYTALKAVLEGGLEAKPRNVLIYATSNRRHLVKEKLSERSGLHSLNHDDEVRAADTMQEKLSMADRFGITVVFTSPDKKRYLEIVEGIATKRGLRVDREILHKEALKWEIWYNGRSPRTARQFVDWMEGYEGMNRA